VPEVLLIGRDWKTRALLRAQLLEEGVDVEAYETFADALEVLLLGPRLIVADLSASENASEELEQLATRSKRVPIWILSSRSLTPDAGLETRGFERVLFRPLQLGDLVSQIKRRLEKR
jgi:DNA-binding response OmpR family regulator